MMILQKIKRCIKWFVPYGFIEHRRRSALKKLGIQNFVTIRPLRLNALMEKRMEFVFDTENEHIRASAVELIAYEIFEKGVTGNVAELGVYRGDFAKIINAAFPERKLYLFDTFEGFDERDLQTEQDNHFSTGIQDFSKTGVELVLSKMPNKGNCVIKKGYFPETTGGMNESFAFVSIDCDLYDPVYKGLHYFYENLNHGGYLLVHDYNCPGYDGVKVAVRKFAEEKKVAFFPLCDCGGSVVIMKP